MRFSPSRPCTHPMCTKVHIGCVQGVKFENISCKLGGREILKNLTGEILHGKITALLGPNGCGKSTFLKALLGLVDLQTGEIFLDQKKIMGLSSQASLLGYMPQSKEIYWPLTCEAITMLGTGGRTEAEIKTVFERLGIMSLREKQIDQVSGGERTLVLLARILISKPQVIVADEPISELDPAYQIRVMKILREEALRGAIVLVTMHDIHLTQRFCDDVFLMKGGEIICGGSAFHILTEKNLRETFQISFRPEVGFYAEG